MLMINPGKCTSWGAEICRGCGKIVESLIRHGVHSCVFGFSDLVLVMQVVRVVTLVVPLGGIILW